MTQLTPNGIKFKDEDQEQTKAVCSVDLVGPDANGNIPVNFSSITTDLTDLEERLDAIGDGQPSYTLEATPNPVGEGVSVTITLRTTNVFQGEEIPYIITPNGISLTDDFVSPIPSTGHFKIENDRADLVLAIKADQLTESSPESFTLTIDTGSRPSITINVNDTSKTPVPTYTLEASPNPAAENQTVTITLRTTNVANGTYVPYTISTSGISLTQDFTSTVASTGNFQVYNNQATRTFPLKQDELTENASESFTLTANVGNNPFVSVSVNDTSQTPESSVSVNTFLSGYRAGNYSGPTLWPSSSASGTQTEENLFISFELSFYPDPVPPVGTVMNWSIVGHNGFNTSDYNYTATGMPSADPNLGSPGISSGTVSVVEITSAFFNITYRNAGVTLLIWNDNISENGESFTITFSNIPNSPNISKTIYVYDPLKSTDIFWREINHNIGM